ncbi:enoyl-CoA hydratase-related protein [Inquilinus sp. Marseille-Q2685]|uniref:hydrogenase maturation protein n=1 Tax=Inquilinus sp. Marseille-Q2685 TaxID=2866581 RepID=UPI001CE3EEC9|nr:enoyl-CoA hydratase-related protein [Inquilinus sp. Marseille-Q2685]
MDILLFASAYNGMVQRVHCELEALGHDVSIELSDNEATMVRRAEAVAPDLIICPFLKHRVPDRVWQSYTCLIVHPGIEGDRGPSSLDWALTRGEHRWGVTLLQADREMDAGDIWGTREFDMRPAGKGSLYRREVIGAAADLIRQALEDRLDPDFRPRPLDYARPQVQGRLHEPIRQASRRIDWSRDSTAEIVTKIQAADGFPGVLDQIGGEAVHLFGAVADPGVRHDRAPGELLGQRHGAICRATRDGAVWIRQLRQATRDGRRFAKLPAMLALGSIVPGLADTLAPLDPSPADEIRVWLDDGVAHIEFDFYNGAMSTEQCDRLAETLRAVKRRDDVRVIVLMGGQDFWSNGIHLNCIEVADSPALESWRNINAMNDLVREIILTPDKITVAALRTNAGAGGAILPLACDVVVARSGVVLNPHYQTMGLYGSEYWTYLLPRRVGLPCAEALTTSCLPVLADDALRLRLVDRVLPEDWRQYHDVLARHCRTLAGDETFRRRLAAKAGNRAADEARRPLESYREEELRRMKATFDDPGASYHRLRRDFVYKITCGGTPARLLALGRGLAVSANVNPPAALTMAG